MLPTGAVTSGLMRAVTVIDGMAIRINDGGV
jgi:hypothetical protein